MRGKACFFQLGDVPAGITPAYAGKSLRIALHAAHRTDHPRLCGEKIQLIASSSKKSGSPPPMRGKAPVLALLARVVGITPAYAGKRAKKWSPP